MDVKIRAYVRAMEIFKNLLDNITIPSIFNLALLKSKKYYFHSLVGKAFPTRKSHFITVFMSKIEITPLVRDEEVGRSNRPEPTILFSPPIRIGFQFFE